MKDKIITLMTQAVRRPRSPIKLSKELKTTKLVETIKKNIKRGKVKKDYVLVYEYLYILAKYSHKREVYKEFELHYRNTANKVHALAKGNRWIIQHLQNVAIASWRRVSMKKVLEIREQVLKVLDGTRTYVGEDLRDVSQPAIDPQQYTATSQDTTSPDDRPIDQQTTQSHVTWDWVNDSPTRSPFEVTIEEIEGLADSLTENDWINWNLGESPGTLRNIPENCGM